ncbi:hypothetical protein HPB47_005442 [Ixodes persulcatus]|uniref:Uncharacterized protein n=1 Tax=Ixodes persulcatus TaxID=34615 RepID=A0AC60PCW9_IXOPE|nr:hypothetical protein HPB47_005442 [Ixodes persulcatus]
MKSSPEVSCLGQDSVHITTKASEQFVALLVREAFKHSKDKKTVQYSDLAAVVDSQDRLDFLNGKRKMFREQFDSVDALESRIKEKGKGVMGLCAYVQEPCFH